MSTRGRAGRAWVADNRRAVASTSRPMGRRRARISAEFYPVRSRAFVPGTVLHRRGEPDALVVLLQDALARDLLLRAHPRVLRLRGARVIAAVEIRRRDQTPDTRTAARARFERRILHTVSRLVDDPTRRAFVFVCRHDLLQLLRGGRRGVAPAPDNVRPRPAAAAPSAPRWSWS